MNGRTHAADIPQEIWEMARRPYHISVRRDDEDDCYVAEVEEFPYLTGAEDTPEAAIDTLREAIALAITAQMRHGAPVAEPHAVTA